MYLKNYKKLKTSKKWADTPELALPKDKHTYDFLVIFLKLNRMW